MRSIKVLAGAVALLASVQAVQAQTPPLAIEIRGDFAIPTGDWNEGDLLENGFGVGLDVMAQVSPQVGVYAGYEMVIFGVDEDVLGDVGDAEAEATDMGIRAGVSLNVPVASYPNLSPFVQLGVLYNSLEISASDGDQSAEIESEAALGFEAGVGVAIAAGPRLDVVPSLRFRQHEIEFEDIEGSEDAQYVVVGIGLRLRM